MSEERVWTPGQQSAIDLRRGDLIISAAAGSGKTAVLCERVIRSLLDENDPINISEMLIVTYTEAAASELKERIADAIRDKMEKTPGNHRLIRQLLLLQSADIGTIHSFCNSLISRNTAKLSLPSGIRVADAFESDLIALKIMEKVIDEAYARDADFASFVENFTMSRDDTLAKELLKIYEKTQSFPEGIELLNKYALEYLSMNAESWEKSRYAKQICTSVKAQSEFYLSVLEDGVKYLKNDDYVYEKWGESFEYDLTYLRKISQAASLGWFALADALKNVYDPPACSQARNVEDSAIKEVQAKRNEYKTKLAAMKGEYYADISSVLIMCERNGRFIRTLYETLSRFEKEFTQEKLRLSVMTFGDLLRMAHRLLVDADGKPTELAREVSERYRQIYIDEYQDTNLIQDEIFRSISRDNRFMVGDIKQCIYSFSGSLPSIFADYRDSFADLDANNINTDDCAHRIFLSNNFRCDKPIIDFSNDIFEVLFRNNSGKIAYLDEDALDFSKKEKEHYDNVSIILAKRDKDLAYYAEALAVAKEVKNILKSGVPAGKIAVIMRSTTEILGVFKNVFEKEGIPTESASQSSLFDSPEILFILALLNCIDNPHRDIWFAGMLSSRVFGIEFNDIVDIATEKYENKPSLYDKFRDHTENGDFARGKRLLAWLSEARENSRSTKVCDIIEEICLDFAVTALAGSDRENAEKAKKNIEIFKDLARNYERSSFKGLHSFLKFVEDIRGGKAGEFKIKSKSSENNDTVKFITAHHSKGLEFEYCFISGCGKNMNDMDTKEKVLLSGTFGAVVRPVGRGGRVKYNSPMYRAMIENMLENQVDEEMRVLYVALTRARKKLYVTAEASDTDKLLSTAKEMRERRSPYVFRANAQYILWVLSSFNKASPSVELLVASATPYYEWKNEGGTVELERLLGEESAASEAHEAEPEKAEISESDGKTEDVTARLDASEIRERLEYSYPHEAELSLPSKLAVSRLFPGVLDVDSVDLVRHEEKFTDIPRFISSGGEGEITGAMRGTATHIFMQFCDFENAEKNGVEIELARLCDKRFIDPATAELVYIDRLKKFFDCELYREMKSAKKLWREKRFNIMLPASEFTESHELKDSLSDAKLLVQGVFDCLIERADGSLKLVDYKTDAVSGNYAADEKMFKERYTTQLSYYKRACELMMGREVSEASVYSFGLGKEIKII